MSIHDVLDKHIRLAILRLLSEVSGQMSNASIIEDALHQMGHSVSRDKIITNLIWLDENNFVRTEILPNDVVVATLRSRGFDIAKGLSFHPEIKSPRPKN